MFPGTNNMWVNVGKSQFHLPTGDPNVLRGHVGLVVPSLEELCERLGEAKKKLADTKFDCKQHNAYVEATCPWGNKFRLYEPDEERFGAINLGMGYVEFTVPEGTADGIARFYREIFYTPACVKENGEGRAAHVCAGHKQELIFRETDQKIPEFDGHHLQVYAQEFSGPHDELEKRGLITEESDQYQYRWQDIVCLETGKHLFTIEHEVRSVHPPALQSPHGQPQPVAEQSPLPDGRGRVGLDIAALDQAHRPAGSRLPSPPRRWPSAAPPAWPRCSDGYP